MGNVTDLPTSATLQVTPELIANLHKEAQALEEVRIYAITDGQTAVLANGMLQEIKRRAGIVEKWDEAFAAPIRQLEQTRKAFFGPAKVALNDAEKYLKGQLQVWTTKEAERIAAEQRAAAEAARKAREQAERDAAAAKARAEAAAAEARRKADEAAAAEKKALAEGNARAAAAAAAERARQEAAEQQKLAEGERKAGEIELAAASAVVIGHQHQASEPIKLAGFSQRKNWIAEYAPDTTDLQAREKVVRAICGLKDDAPLARTDLLALLPLDMKAANKLARAQEAHFNVPGLKARNAPIAASKG